MAGDKGFIYELLDELIAKFIMNTWNRLTGAKDSPAGTSGGQDKEDVSATLNVSREETQEAIGLLWGGPRIDSEARNNFILAMRALGSKRSDQFERGLGALLKQLKNGIWASSTEKIVETFAPSQHQEQQDKKQGENPKVVKTTERRIYERGWNPSTVFVRIINTAGESTESVKNFVEMLLQESVWDRTAEGFNVAVKKSAKIGGWTALCILLLYIVLVVLSGRKMYSALQGFVNDPTQTGLLVWGGLWMLAFASLLWIVAKPLLPKEI